MHRRAYLRGVAATAGLAAARPAAAHPTPAGSDGGPATPTGGDPLGFLELPGAHEAVVSPDGDTAFVATGEGVAAVNLSTPADPALRHDWTVWADHPDGPMDLVWDLHLDGDRLLVCGPAQPTDDSPRGLVVYDVADPAAPERVATHELESAVHNGVLADGLAAVTAHQAEGAPVVFYDVTAGEEVGRWSLATFDGAWGDVHPALWAPHDVWLQGDRCYVAHWDAGTWILDVTDPGAPDLLGRVRGADTSTLRDVDVAEGLSHRPGNDHFVTVNEDATLMGVGIEAWAAEDGDAEPGGIVLYDVADPRSPQPLAEIDPPPAEDATRDGTWVTAHNFELVGDRLYAAWYRGGATVHDVASPADPVKVFHWRDSAAASLWTLQLASPGGAMVASSWGQDELDEPGGLLTFADPARPTPTPTEPPTDSATPTASPPPRDPLDAAVVGGVLALLGGAAGVGAWLALGGDGPPGADDSD